MPKQWTKVQISTIYKNKGKKKRLIEEDKIKYSELGQNHRFKLRIIIQNTHKILHRSFFYK